MYATIVHSPNMQPMSVPAASRFFEKDPAKIRELSTDAVVQGYWEAGKRKEKVMEVYKDILKERGEFEGRCTAKIKKFPTSDYKLPSVPFTT